MRRFIAALPPCAAVLLLTACTSYQYAITEAPPPPPEFVPPPTLPPVVLPPSPPAEESMPVVGGEAREFERDGLVYLLNVVDNRLVMRIRNPGPEPVKLEGDESWSVIPDGQSLPLRSLTIAPGAFVRFTLPPEPRRQREGPRLSLGVGTVFGSGGGIGTGVGVGTGVGSRSVYVDQPWNWPVDQPVRLHLAYRRGDQRFSHDWTFVRRPRAS